MPDEIAQTAGYGASMQCRKRIEQGVGWVKDDPSSPSVMVRGFKKVAQLFVLDMAADNLVRMRSLGQVRLRGAR